MTKQHAASYRSDCDGAGRKVNMHVSVSVECECGV